MKTGAFTKLVLASAVLIGPGPLFIRAAESVPASSTNVHIGLTADARTRFLNEAENALHSNAKVTSAFWPWLKKHSAVRVGLLTSADPVPAVYAENLDHLRIAMGPAIADKYAQLLLGVSLTDQLEPKTAQGGDGAYNQSAYASVSNNPDTNVARVANYLKQNNITLQDFVDKADDILSKLHLADLTKKDRNSFVENVAYATKTYPPRTPLPLVACLKKLIGRYETKIGPFNDKGPEWPLFPIDLAPFPLLAPLRQTLPERELDYLWERFNGRIEGAKDRLPTYGHYTFDYEKPEIRYKQSDWNPTALPRIIEDGGVCGRLSTLAQLSAVGLGRPAVGMYQPGHRALLTYHGDPKTGHYSASMDQAITGPDKSTNQWFMPAPRGLRVNPEGTVVGVEWHFALALSMNLGLNRYTDSRICMYLAKDQPSQPRKLDLLQTAVEMNPYNLEAWYALASVTGPDTTAINQLLARMDALLFNPDSGTAQQQELAANTDLRAHMAKETADLKKQSNIVASMLGDAITEATYKTALDDKSNATKNLANLKAEIDRRAAMKLPHGAEVLALVDSYSMAGGGATSTQEDVTTEVQKLETGSVKDRKKKSDEAEKRIEAVVKGSASPADAAAWLKTLYDSFPSGSRFAMSKESKVEVDPLYAYLHSLLDKTLKSTGREGALQAKQIDADFVTAKNAVGTK
jgi:hypothetical protein